MDRKGWSDTQCWQCLKAAALDEETGLCRECADKARFEQSVARRGELANEAIEALHKLANDAAGREALKRRLEREHRTNQQLVCVSIRTMLEKWQADGEKGAGWYDARNEGSVKFAEKALEATKDVYLPYI
jgi:hypothetical protein